MLIQGSAVSADLDVVRFRLEHVREPFPQLSKMSPHLGQVCYRCRKAVKKPGIVTLRPL